MPKLTTSLTHQTFPRLIYSLSLFLFSASTIQAQYLVERTITVEDGLPSNETYSSYFDEEGNLWVLTDRGLAKYDGKKVTVLDKKNGFPSNAIFKHFTDPSGKKWFIADSEICYMKGDSIMVPPFQKEFRDIPEFVRPMQLIFLNNERLIVRSRYSACSYALVNLKTNRITKQCEPAHKAFSVQKKGVGNKTCSFGLLKKDNSFLFKYHRLMQGVYSDSPDSVWYFFDRNFLPNVIKMSQAYTADSSLIYFSEGHTIFELNHSKRTKRKLYTSKEKILDLHLCENFLYIAHWDKGVKRINLQNGYKEWILKGIGVSSVNVHENKLYCSSLKRGLIVLNLKTKKLFDLPRPSTNTPIAKPLLFDGSYLKFFAGGSVYTYKFDFALTKTSTEVISGLKGFFEYNTVNWATPDSLFNALHSISISKNLTTPLPFDYQLNLVNTYSSKYSQADYFYGVSGFLKTLRKKQLYSSSAAGFSKPIYCLVEYNADSLLLATKDGLYSFNGYDIKAVITKSLALNNSSVKLIENCMTFSAYGTSGDGLFLDKDGVITAFNANNGLLGNFVQSLLFQRDTLWIGTGKALQFVWFANDKFNISPALFKGEVADILKAEKGVFIHNNESMYAVYPNNLSFTKPELTLSNTFNPNISNNSALILRKNDNITFSYALNSLWDEQHSVFAYRLLPNDTNWIYDKASGLTLDKLDFDTYSFEIKGRDAQGVWSKTKMRSFEVKPYIYQRFWFEPLLYTLLGLLIGIVIYMLQKQKDRDLRRENLLLHSSLNSLKLQINPHFIFNALNSLQYLIAADKKKQSAKFLTHFAGLVRDILDSSQENLVTIEEEIKRLNTYLGLEEARLEKGNIDLEIHNTTPYELSELLIPNMLLQPLVENAIWHGFVNSEKQPKLQMNLYNKEEKQVLLLELIDNGVGMEISQLAERQQQGSLAIKNIQERLRILSRLERKTFRINFEKAYVTHGTKITLHLPLKV